MRALVQRGDAAAYALGALDRAEREAFEQLAWRDAVVAREVAQFTQVAALLAFAAPPAAPSSVLRERVMALAN